MHETATFLIQFGLVVVGLGALARVARGFGLSPIPLYLLAGLVIGEGGPFPLAGSDFIDVGAQLGAILLLLMLGIEFTADELTSALRRSAPAGAFDAVLNFTPGVVAGFVLGWSPLASLFLGGVTYISSSGIISKLLEDLEWLPNRETPVILSILVIEDLAMVVYLPLMAALVVGGGGAATAISVGVAVVVMGLTLLAAMRLGPLLSTLIYSRSREAMLLTFIGLAVVVAGGAERLSAGAAVGAFLVGIALSGQAAEHARVLLRPVRDLFAAVFFVAFGMGIDLTAISGVLVAAFVIAVVTGATKALTGWWSARRVGVGQRARRRAGAALIARGEFSIVIAGIGSAAGVEEQLGPLAATYVLLLGIVGPLASRGIDVWSVRHRVRQLLREGAEGRRTSGPTDERSGR